LGLPNSKTRKSFEVCQKKKPRNFPKSPKIEIKEGKTKKPKLIGYKFALEVVKLPLLRKLPKFKLTSLW